MYFYNLMHRALVFLGKFRFPRIANWFSSRLFTTCFLVVLLSSKSALATPVTAVELFDPLENYQNDFSWTLGYSFYLDEDANLIELGFYDALGDGFNEDHEVGLWDEFGTLLASVVVTNNSRLDSLFRWEAITPVELIAGVQYTIAGFTSIDDYTWNPQDYYVNDQVWFTCAGYTFSESLEYPSECYYELIGFFGPNFIFDTELDVEPPVDVSEPNALPLLLFGMALFSLVLFARRAENKHRMIALLVSPAIFALPNAANAITLISSTTQGDATIEGQFPLGNKYHRYLYQNVGGLFEYPNPFDNQGNYIVPVGETLRFALYRDGMPFSSYEVRYLGGNDHCWVINNSSQTCGTYNRWFLYIPATCFGEKQTYKMRLTQNGAVQAEQEFKAQRFKMKLNPSTWTLPTELRPMRYNLKGAGVGEKKPLLVKVEDDLGCGVGLEDVEVTVQSTVGSYLNEHDHFKAGDKGTGRFVANGQPITLSEENTKAEGKTNSSGVLKLDYQAMHFALKENVKFTFKRPAKDGEPEQKQTLDRTWDIKYGDYVEDSYGYEFKWTYSCNRAHTHDGAVHLRQDVWDALYSVTSFFTFKTDKVLTLNDGSFPWGGAVDTVNSNCKNHASHRTGNDIDINGYSLGSAHKDIVEDDHVLFSYTDPNFGNINIKVPYITLLTQRAESQGFSRVKEEEIHYRYQH